MRKTKWYPASLKPVRVGYYETMRYEVAYEAEGLHKLYWNGTHWEYAYNVYFCRKGDYACMIASAGDKWRGLTEPHHA